MKTLYIIAIALVLASCSGHSVPATTDSTTVSTDTTHAHSVDTAAVKVDSGK